MSDALESFILWSGWIAAVGIAIYEIVKAYRNRIKIKVTLTVSKKELCIGVHNWGRRPVNLIEAGLRYANGKSSIYDDLDNFFPQLLYKNDGRNLCFNTKEVINELKANDTEIIYGYFADESGREYKTKASDEFREVINGLIGSGKTVSK